MHVKPHDMTVLVLYILSNVLFHRDRHELRIAAARRPRRVDQQTEYRTP
jgi:hypothetical protein